MEPNEIIEFTTKSFLPYTCSAKIVDYGAVVNFKVRDENRKTILTVDKLPIDTDMDNLKLTIAQDKEDIRQRGYNLD